MEKKDFNNKKNPMECNLKREKAILFKNRKKM